VRCTREYLIIHRRRAKRKTKMEMNKAHASYMKRMKAKNNMNITHVMHMTMQERKNYYSMERRNQWRQVGLKAMQFFTESAINNNTEPIMTTTKKEQCKQCKMKLTKELGRSN
jgi:hypothetical protein